MGPVEFSVQNIDIDMEIINLDTQTTFGLMCFGLSAKATCKTSSFKFPLSRTENWLQPTCQLLLLYKFLSFSEHRDAISSLHSSLTRFTPLYYSCLPDKYSLVIDETAIRYEQLKTCEITRMEQNIFPMVYSVGLQNNSVYNEDFALAWVALLWLKFSFFIGSLYLVWKELSPKGVENNGFLEKTAVRSPLSKLLNDSCSVSSFPADSYFCHHILISRLFQRLWESVILAMGLIYPKRLKM